MRHGKVDDEQPEGGVHNHGAELDAFGVGSGDERRRDDGEHQLEGHEGQLRDGGGVVAVRVNAHSVEEQVLGAADDGVPLSEREAVADDRPDDGCQRHEDEAVHQGTQDVFLTDEAPVEEGEARAGHQQYKCAARQHPGIVAGRLGRAHSAFERFDFLRQRVGRGLSHGQRQEGKGQTHLLKHSAIVSSAIVGSS